MSEIKDDAVKGIRIRTLSMIMSIIMCVLCFILLCLLISVKFCYNTMVHTMDDYVECDKAVTDFTKASNYLTNQSRFFIVNQDVAYLDNYFSEYKTLKHRETSIEIVELTHKDDEVDVQLQRAFNESSKLARTELYAMKLCCDSMDFDYSEYDDLQKIELKAEDAALSTIEKRERAQTLLFNNDYLYSKSRIDIAGNAVISALINTVLVQTAVQNKQIRSLFIFAIIDIVMLIIFAIVQTTHLNRLVINPLVRGVESIQNGVKMSIKGAYEVNFIAKTYNELCDKTVLTASILKHKAEHDPLTGLINREAFAHIKDALRDVPEAIAYLIVDIDFFKQVNDKYGHSVGDDVLRKISNLLMEQFRATDYVARIGGDEFAIIMTKFGSTPAEIIQKKIDGLNFMLQNVTDGLPSVSLSVGVAFSEMGYKDVLVNQADSALYKVKRGGRCNCSFFQNQPID